MEDRNVRANTLLQPKTYQCFSDDVGKELTKSDMTNCEQVDSRGF
jgi:hypothetical protein